VAAIGADTEIREVLDQMIEALGVKAVVDDFTVHGETNDVAWAVGQGHFENKSGASTRPVRISAVLVRDADRWTVVHSHASIGVPNAEMFG
jgi:hypothetical protein